MPTTLTIDGLPEGDEPNTVVVKYTKPVEDKGAWETATFTVTTFAVAEGVSVKKTQLDLPGVYRMSEASNKAIAKLYRANDRLRVSFVSSDEGIIFQPGDMITVTDALRGVDIDVWVESNVMVSYGRYRITGIVYSDGQFPDTCYTEDDEVGSWLNEVVTITDIDDGGTSYSCNAYYAFIDLIANPIIWYPYTQGGPVPSLGTNDEIIDVVAGKNLIVDEPYSENDPEGAVDFAHCSGAYFWTFNYDGVGDSSQHLFNGDTGVAVSENGFWISVILIGWGGSTSSITEFNLYDGSTTWEFTLSAGSGAVINFGAPMTGNPTAVNSSNSITGTAPVSSTQINLITLHYKNPNAGGSSITNNGATIDIYSADTLVYTKPENLVTSLKSGSYTVKDIRTSAALQGAKGHMMIGNGAPNVSGMYAALKRNFVNPGSPLPYYEP